MVLEPNKDKVTIRVFFMITETMAWIYDFCGVTLTGTSKYI
jgi:hypothetical protein